MLIGRCEKSHPSPLNSIHFFYQLCIRCDLCGLGKARYPTMHYTLANDSSSNAEKSEHPSTEVQGTTPEVHHTED